MGEKDEAMGNRVKIAKKKKKKKSVPWHTEQTHLSGQYMFWVNRK